MRDHPHRARAAGGFTLIELMIVIALIAIIAAIAIPNLIEARKGSNEAAAIGALRTITTAQALFREGDKDKRYADDLDDLAAYLDPPLAAGIKQGYTFVIIEADNFEWSARGDPASPKKSGDRYFFVDESGVIRGDNGDAAGPLSTPIVDLRDCPPDVIRRCCPRDADATVSDTAIKTVAFLDGLSGGRALTMASDLLSSSDTVMAKLRDLDKDHDGRLSFDEALDPNLPGMTRADDPASNVLRSYFKSMRRHLELDLPNEELPTIPLGDLRGDPVRLLSQVKPRGASNASSQAKTSN